MIKTIDVKSTEKTEVYRYLSNAVTPRPIAFVSTIDKKGNKNLSPFSFFNSNFTVEFITSLLVHWENYWWWG